MLNIITPSISGVISLDSVDDVTGDRERIADQANQVQYSWGTVASECIGKGNRNFRISAMYLEFENMSNPSNAVTAPTYERDEGLEYYQALESSGVRDYLRVPLLLPAGVDIATGFESYFTEGVNGNRLTFYSQSQGAVGVHGKVFSDSVHSKLFGVALVATPVFADPSQDVIFSRTYLTSDKQGLKQASKSLGITWRIIFG